MRPRRVRKNQRITQDGVVGRPVRRFRHNHDYVVSNMLKLTAAARIADGLQDGLEQYAGPTKVGVILCLEQSDELLIWDPNELLPAYVQDLQKGYFDSNEWRKIRQPAKRTNSGFWKVTRDLFNQPGLVDVVVWSSSVFVQHWFIEQHANLGSVGIIYNWIDQAALNISRDLAYTERLSNSGSSAELTNYAMTAALQELYHRQTALKRDKNLEMADPNSCLQAALRLSAAVEEGKKASGQMMFIHESELEQWLQMGMVFSPHQELPRLADTKHSRKLLTLSDSVRCLVSDGEFVRGIMPILLEPPENALIAEFQAGQGVLTVGSEAICGFVEGRVTPFAPHVNLHDLRVRLRELQVSSSRLESLIKVVENVLDYAREQRFGCTICLDFSSEPSRLKGEYFETPIDARSNIDLVRSAASIDGALHMDKNGYLLGFACLFDGPSIEDENRARGARYNSALRFSAKPGQETSIIVVASEDGYLNLFQGAQPYGALGELVSGTFEDFALLAHWLQNNS